jgi:peptide/nickel transport system substrate-binding protein
MSLVKRLTRRGRRVPATAEVLLWICLIAWLPACRDTRTPADAIPQRDKVVVLIPEPIKGVLDPRLNTRSWPAKAIHLMYLGVVSVHNAQGEPRPGLAERIDQPTPSIYDITLRANATFHDGSPVTPADVIATYESVRNPALKSPFRGLYARITQMQQTGPRALRITLDAPHAPFLSDMSMGIVPARAIGADGQLTAMIGAGPYQFAGRSGDREVRLRRHAGYWGGAPAIEWIVLRTIRDQNTRLLALLGGAADLVQNAVTPRLAEAMQGRDGLVVTTAPGAGYTYVALNLRRKPLNDARVRAAIAHALDRPSMITHKFRGTATPATGLLPTRHWAYNADVPKHPYDPQRAEALLDAAGLSRDPKGVRFTLEFKTSADKFRRNMATLIARDLGKVGIEVQVKPLETGTMLADVKAGNFDAYMLQWQGGGEPHFFNWIFSSERIPDAEHPNRGGNRGAYVNARVDALIEAGRAEAALDKRRPIYGEIQTILAAEQPYISLWHEDVIVVHRAGLEGYTALPNASLFNLWMARWR